MGIQAIVHDIKTIKIPIELIDQIELNTNGLNATVIHITIDGWKTKKEDKVFIIYRSSRPGDKGITGKDYILTKPDTKIIKV